MSKCAVHNSCDWPSLHVITFHCLLLLTLKGKLNLGHTKKKIYVLSSMLFEDEAMLLLPCRLWSIWFHLPCLLMTSYSLWRVLSITAWNIVSCTKEKAMWFQHLWLFDNLTFQKSLLSVLLSHVSCVFLVMLPEKQSGNCRFSCILGVFSETMYIKGKFPWMTLSLLIFTEKVSWMACNRHLSSSILVLSLRGCLFVLFAVVIFHLCHFPCVSIFNRNVNRVEALRHLLHRLRCHWCRATSCKRGDTSWWMRCDWRWTWSGARTSSGRAVRRADGVREWAEGKGVIVRGLRTLKHSSLHTSPLKGLIHSDQQSVTVVLWRLTPFQHAARVTVLGCWQHVYTSVLLVSKESKGNGREAFLKRRGSGRTLQKKNKTRKTVIHPTFAYRLAFEHDTTPSFCNLSLWRWPSS